MRTTIHRPKGTPVSAERREQLQELIHDCGELGAAEKIGINRLTLSRALAGLPIARGTHAILAAALPERR